MSETRLTIEQIIAAVNQLKPDEMAILDKHLSQLRRERMRELTKQARQRTAHISETEINYSLQDKLFGTV